MSRLPTSCPSCSAALKVTRLDCSACEARLEGSFELPRLLRLPEDDLQFVLQFVRASGSLKEIAKLREQSYPTIRNRLNAIIAQLGANNTARDHRRHEILDAIAKGQVSVADATKQLKDVDS